jgi:hypothetical protein
LIRRICLPAQMALYSFGRPCRGRLVSNKNSFIEDQRGAIAFEMPIVWLFLMMSLLLPLADVAIAGFQFVSAWEAGPKYPSGH